MHALISKKANCKNCYKCLRSCPVKSIRFEHGQAEIMPDECVYCGTCLGVCPQGAKQVRNEVPRAKELIAGGSAVVSLAPSFIGGFEVDDPLRVVGALRALGFAGVYETSEGAAVISDEMARLAAEPDAPDVLLSTCCPAVTNLIEKHYPDLTGALFPLTTPATAHARLIKERRPEAKVVFVGPCVAKIDEADDPRNEGAIDAVLTFAEVADWLREAGIALATAEPSAPDGFDAGLAKLYPTTSGILDNLVARGVSGYSLLHAEGMDECYQVVSAIKEGRLHRCIVEMSSCPGSCLGGPALAKPLNGRFESRIELRAYTAKTDVTIPEAHTSVNLKKTFMDRSSSAPLPTEEELAAVLHSMGKETRLDELNCGSCGYDSCRKKAVAVFQHKAELSMCLPHMMEQAQSMSGVVLDNTPNMIFVADREMRIAELNSAAQKHLGLTRSQGLTHYIYEYLDISDFDFVLESHQPITDKKVQFDADTTVVETLIYLPKQDGVMAILRDITKDEERERDLYNLRLETMNMAQKVINKQMVAAQEIASLLGETTAETKSTLTNLKNMILGGEDEKK